MKLQEEYMACHKKEEKQETNHCD